MPIQHDTSESEQNKTFNVIYLSFGGGYIGKFICDFHIYITR